MRGEEITDFHKNYAVQLTDTHPSIAIAELMRIFVDEYHLDWQVAWEITQKTFAYTNHTVLPEALEKWPVPLFQELLPRHLQIIYEINEKFLNKVRTKGVNLDAIRNLSIIEETGNKFISMAKLATIGSHAVNGVSGLHSQLVKQDVLSEFYALEPDKFHNVTNGVTPRRWILLSNPKLAKLITENIGDRWIVNMQSEIHKLEKFVEEPKFREAWKRH